MRAGAGAAKARAADDAALQNAARQMQKLMLTLSSHKDSISRATTFALLHAKRGGAARLTEVIACRTQEVRAARASWPPHEPSHPPPDRDY